MLERLNRVASSRMRPDLEAAIEYLPGLASLALWCRFADTDDADTIAFTDGSTIYAGADYEQFDCSTRRFICLHEILHVALCHPQRTNCRRNFSGSNLMKQRLSDWAIISLKK